MKKYVSTSPDKIAEVLDRNLILDFWGGLVSSLYTDCAELSPKFQ
jgi:hypothetical protein